MHFRGKYSWLSNFAVCTVEYKGDKFKTLENAYQAAKSDDASIRKQFTIISPVVAKRRGRQIKVRADWEDVKVRIMRELLVQKFAIPYYRTKLEEITEPIVEENTWHDEFWGVCNGHGQNILGKLIEEIKQAK